MQIWFWIGFILLVCLMLALDLGVFHRKSEEINTKSAFFWTGVWIACALVFNVFIYYAYEHHLLGIGLHSAHNVGGSEAALKFFTGYLIEKSLSLDNIFVIAMIFAYFNIPLKHQHNILFWGILGALIFRGVMILLGVALIERFAWITYLFGAILMFSAFKMLTARHDSIEPYNNPLIKFVKRFYPVHEDISSGKFFTRLPNNTLAMTPLFVALLVVETTDVMFAVDSIPAIFAVTTDAFIVFTSNVFAILGLRSLYFVLASVMEKFRYLKISLVFVLVFVGVKMLLIHHYKFPIWVSLSVIIGILSLGVVASLISGSKDPAKLKSPIDKQEA